jgi:methylmalonyl-CoA mutase N-terminal domain/subunit
MTSRFSRSGIPLRPFYTAADGAGEEPPPAPGEYPFTRGRLASAKGGAGWIQRGLSGEGDAAASNAQLRYLIANGQTGIDVIGDSPTQAMMDPDHPLAVPAVGTQGVSLCCKEDYVELLRGIALDSISISSSVPPVFSLAGLYLAARAGGAPLETLRGSVLQAPLYMEDCGYPVHMPCELRARLSADVMAFCAEHLPRFHAFVEDTYFFSEAGLNAVEEMALGFVEIRFLVREMLRRGIAIDRFAPRIAILVNCSMDFFEEIAKLRAVRRLYARMVREEFGARDPRSWSVNITSHTSGLALTAQQPVNNVVRGAVQALALALGGAQAIEVSAFDEAYRIPSRAAHRVGLRTQQILELEAGVANVADPLGGSYYVEALTAELERRIRALVAEIEAAGDPVHLADSGWFRSFFQRAAERHSRELQAGTRNVVGGNIHRDPPEEDTLLADIAGRRTPPDAGRAERVRRLRQARPAEAVRRALRDTLAAARRRDVNVMPTVIAAFDAGATMGEIAGVFRVAYGFPYDPHRMIANPMEEAAS